MLRFDGSEAIRSVQLYGTDPRTLGEAVRFLVGEIGVDHVDMNFGCPVPKVTRKGGGSALPVRRALLRNIIRSAVTAAGRSEEHTSELQSLMRISYAVFCLKKKKTRKKIKRN